MKSWTVFCNTHVAWYTRDLTPIVAALQRDGRPFFGPTLRADGVKQLYVELPFHHYLEIDSNVYHYEEHGLPRPKPWAEIDMAAGGEDTADAGGADAADLALRAAEGPDEVLKPLDDRWKDDGPEPILKPLKQRWQTRIPALEPRQSFGYHGSAWLPQG